MSNISGGKEPPTNASYLRSLPTGEAVAAKNAIGVFFGNVQAQPVAADAAQRKTSIVRPAAARWVLYSGAVLLIASLLTYIFHDRVGPSTPGIFLGAGGLALAAAGLAYWWFASKVVVDPEPATKTTIDRGRDAVERQIKHVEDKADVLFGPVADGGRRFVLQGIGRRQWNGDHDIPIREFENDRIFATVVHLAVIDLTRHTVAVREMGLDLTTGTICEESAIRRPIQDVLSATRRAKKIAAAGEWDRAENLVKKRAAIKTSDPRTSEAMQRRAAALDADMARLTFDDTTGDEFKLHFTGDETVTLNVADMNFAKNLRKVAYPIGGKENLDTVIAAWAAVDKARIDAEADRHQHRAAMQSSTRGTEKGVGEVHQGITTAQQGLAGFQDALLQGIGVVVQKLSGLETAMHALAATNGATAGTMSDRAAGDAAASTLAPAAASAATTPGAATRPKHAVEPTPVSGPVVAAAVNGSGDRT